MSTDPEAKLFYGYIQPEKYRELFNEEDDPDFDTRWSAIHTKEAHGCEGGMYGYSGQLGFFLAVSESYKRAEWDTITPLTQEDLTIKPEWDEQLRLAAAEFQIDITGLQPGWHLVCLYF